MLKINELARIYLGVQQENAARTIRIDMSAWVSIYPNASVEILHKRSGDETKYLTGATYDSETKILSWTPTDYDTYYEGFGVAEIRMVENSVVKKSKDLIVVAVSPSVIDGTGETIASNYQAWLDTALSYKQGALAAQEAAETAQEKAEDAQDAAEDAQDAAELALEKYPKIDATSKHWMVWDTEEGEYTDTGIKAEGVDGSPGDPTTLIDDTTGDGTTNKTWSANKIYDELAGKYEKPGTGIPSSDMASAVQTSLGKADTAYQLPSGGVPKTDMASAVQTSLGKADTAYQLPSGGIPAEDIASGVIPNPTSIIDDEAGAGDTDKVFSADKLTTDFSGLNIALNGKQDAPASGATAGKVLGLTEVSNELVPTWVAQPTVPVTDVQVNGTSILSQGVANVPKASSSVFGVVQVSQSNGTDISTQGVLRVSKATDSDVKGGTSTYKPIVPSNQHMATFFGLAKCAGDTTQSSSSNAVGVYTEDALKKIKKMLAIHDEWEVINEYTVAENSDNVIIDTDSNGQAFSLSKMLVRIEFSANTTGSNDYVVTNVIATKTNGTSATISNPSVRYASGGVAGYAESFVELIGDVIRTQIRNTNTNAPGNTVALQTASSDIALAFKSINGFKFAKYNASATQIPSGTKVKIYGIRID